MVRRLIHSNRESGDTADLMRHTEITLQDDTDSKYHLGLFVGNQKIELQTSGIGTRTWTPVQISYAPHSRYIRSLKALCS